jgi:hypothetical protein
MPRGYFIHGLLRGGKYPPTYNVWRAMRQRCLNPKKRLYHNYGGRGITVCERWNSFANFASDMGPCPPGHTLDRIDNDGPYEPSNCRWATRSQQQRNRRNVRPLTFQGRTMLISDWAKELGIDSNTIQARIDNYGWSVERALSTAPRPWGR